MMSGQWSPRSRGG